MGATDFRLSMKKTTDFKFTGDPEPAQSAEMPRSEFAALVDALADGIVVINGQGVIARANPAVCAMFGYNESDLVGQNVAVLMTSDDASKHDHFLKSYLDTGRANIIGLGREVVGRHISGQTMWLDLSVTPAHINHEQMFVGFLRDITERKEAQKMYDSNTRIMRSVNRALSNVINEGLTTREVFNAALEDLLDVTESEYGFIGEILHDENVPYLKTHAITNIAWSRETREFYRKNVRAGLEFRNLDSLFGVTIRSGQMVIANEPSNDSRRGGLPKGHPSLDRYLGMPIYSGSKLLGMAGVANREEGYDEDLVDQVRPLVSAMGTLIAAHQNTESRIRAEEELFRARQQLRQMATKDPVTGIANRYMLVQELEVEFERCSDSQDLSILFIDVDHFKRVNDKYGHNLGDEVLQYIATLIEKSIRPNDIAGRYGGEEFVVGLPGCALEQARIIAERMRAALNDSPYELEDGSLIDLSISIGLASTSQKPNDLSQLLKFADEAVYQAKDHGRNVVFLYGR
jgi:diguanylate cyclase (GGDEF)-like protein/PAS domain S-box-containing protein